MLQVGCAKCHLGFPSYRKEIKSLTQGHLEVALRMRQIMPSRSPILADRNRVEINRLLQLKSQNEAVIRERKAQLAELDKQVGAPGVFPG